MEKEMQTETDSVIIIPHADETLLQWISTNQMVVFEQSKAALSDMFESEYVAIKGKSVRHVILLYTAADTLTNVTSIAIAHSGESLEMSCDEIEKASYPYRRPKHKDEYNYFAIKVDADSLEVPQLQIDNEKLLHFVGDRMLDGSSLVVSISELQTEGIVSGVSVEADEREIVSVADLLSQSDKKQRAEEQHQSSNNSEVARMKEAKELLRVEFGDGTVMCDRKAVVTFVEAIEKIGSDRVAALGLTYCNTPLLSREYSSNKNYAAAQKKVGDGWLLFTQGPIAMKYITLRNISNQLSLDLKIEHGADLEPITRLKIKHEKSSKNNLRVTFANGETIERANSRTTFMATIMHIGIDRVARLKLNIAGAPLVSNHPLAACIQEKATDNAYITIPNGTKRMYKFLIVIAAMTHEHISVEII